MDAAHACVNNAVRAVLCLRPTLIKLMRTGNPVLNDTTFREATLTGERRMTLTGTVNATLMFVTLLLAAAMFTWNKASVDPGGAMVWVSGGAIAGLILALVTVFKKEWAMWTGSLYAVAEGLLLGGLSAMYEAQFNGIVLQAVLLTAGTKGKRYVLPHAKVMIHQPYGGVTGQAEDIRIQAEQIIRSKTELNRILAKHTGQPLENIQRDSERDKYFSAEEAKAYGLVDEVLSETAAASAVNAAGKA